MVSYERGAPGVVARGLGWIVDGLWPEKCLACGDLVGPGLIAPRLGLCRPCTAKLQTAAAPCRRCGAERDPELGGAASDGAPPPCAACRHAPPPWRRLSYVWRYGPPLDAVIIGLKFRRLDYLAGRLAGPLAAALTTPPDSPGADAAPPDAVVPVPLHWTRRLRRGYDQADLLATAVARRLGWRRLRALRRRRATPRQSDRDRRHRRANVRSAFRVRRPVEGLHLLLVDDVVTTGSTLGSAAGALLAAGAAAVDAAVVARTPAADEASDLCCPAIDCQVQ